MAILTLTLSCADDGRLPLAVGPAVFRVEVARTAEERNMGLMHRLSLEENQGMVFIFEEEQVLSFWMRNTLIPLSIAFIGRSGVILDIQDMQPRDESTVRSSRPALYALEVNQGAFGRQGVMVGDKVNLASLLE